MGNASYDGIAEWYDRFLYESPLYRDVLIPALLELIGDVQGQVVCDLACGQGWVARLLAQRGAQVTGVDLSDQQVALARQYEDQQPLGIVYKQDDAQNASSLTASSFDGCVCVVALMDIPDLQAVFLTSRRILKPGGWLVIAITHPCFETPHAQWMTLSDGREIRAVSGYFQEGFWKSEGGGIRSRVGAHHRMLSTYLNALTTARLSLDRMVEPIATGERAELVPGSREVPQLMLMRVYAI